MVSSIVELPPLSIDDGDGSGSASTSTTGKTIRQFRLTLDGVTVELSSLGASVTRVLLPRDLQRWEQGEEEEEEEDDASPSSAEASGGHDDVVLSYASPEQQMRDRNRPFFGAIVGRVANRIGDGRFCLRQEAGPGAAATPPETYKLERNDGPNHLHGGSDGFWNRIWDASIVDGGAEVRFALVSPDGDQGYPGGVEVVASYSLVRVLRGDGMADAASSARGIVGARLRLVMRANLLPGETRATPICMAGHSYFNLAGHSSPSRILDHVLRLPNCEKYTPLDGTSIPTREVRSVGRLGAATTRVRLPLRGEGPGMRGEAGSEPRRECAVRFRSQLRHRGGGRWGRRRRLHDDAPRRDLIPSPDTTLPSYLHDRAGTAGLHL